MFTVEVPGSEVSECDMEEAELQLEPCISVNALAGNHTYQTMRVRGLVNGKPLHILVDSGSTHNFLDEELASTLNIEVKKISPQSIAVADGNSISCTQLCTKFSWGMSDKQFSAEAMLIPLGSCDMVLGIQWLSTLGPIYWDFKKLRMDFVYNDEPVSLKGVPPKKLKILEKQAPKKILTNAAQLCFLQLITANSETVNAVNCKKSTNEYQEVVNLKEKYS